MLIRRWATDVLRRCVIDGNAENEKRLAQLGQVARVMARIPDDLETRQVLDIAQSYTVALDLLDDYDHQRLAAPKGDAATYALEYEECRRVIDGMRFSGESDLFGVEKDAMVALAMNFLMVGRNGYRRGGNPWPCNHDVLNSRSQLTWEPC